MKNTMQCSHAQNLFSAHLDRDLDPAATKLLEEHLASCGPCAQEWQYFEKTMDFVHEELPVSAPPDLLSGIHEKIYRPNPLTAFWNWLREFDFSLSVPAAAATLAVAFVTAMTVKFVVIEQQNPFDNQSWGPSIARNTETAPQSAERKAPKRTVEPTQFATSTSRSTTPHVADRSPHSRMLQPFEVDNQTAELLGTPYGLDMLPDMVVTVHTRKQKIHAALHYSLMNNQDWRVQRHGDDLILVFLKPDDLPKLHQKLVTHGVRLSPQSQALSSAGKNKEMLAVAVHLK